MFQYYIIFILSIVYPSYRYYNHLKYKKSIIIRNNLIDKIDKTLIDLEWSVCTFELYINTTFNNKNYFVLDNDELYLLYHSLKRFLYIKTNIDVCKKIPMKIINSDIKELSCV